MGDIMCVCGGGDGGGVGFLKIVVSRQFFLSSTFLVKLEPQTRSCGSSSCLEKSRRVEEGWRARER